jgi:hypothetical protein
VSIVPSCSKSEAASTTVTRLCKLATSLRLAAVASSRNVNWRRGEARLDPSYLWVSSGPAASSQQTVREQPRDRRGREQRMHSLGDGERLADARRLDEHVVEAVLGCEGREGREQVLA